MPKPPKASAPRALIYTRVSSDKSGKARSPQEQEAELRAVCDREGWRIVAVITDNDMSASRHARKDRPGFAELKARVTTGDCDLVVAWEGSRFARDVAVYAALADLCRKQGVRLAIGSRVLDLDDPDDAFQGNLDAALAQRESDVTRKRVKRTMAAHLEAGGVHGRVQLGYRRVYDPRTGALVGQEIDESTAPFVRLIFDRIAAGIGTMRIADELNNLGSRTRTGRPWTANSVRQQVEARASYLGHRVHNGQVAVRDCWPALVDEETYDAVQARLRGGRTVAGRDTSARYLLAGILRCAECGGPCYVDPRSRDATPVPRYVCRGLPGSGKRGCASKRADDVDKVVTTLALVRIARGHVTASSGAQDRQATATALATERAKMAAAEEDYAEDRITARAFQLKRERLEPRITDLERELAAVLAPVPAEVQELASSRDIEAHWERLPLESKRSVIRHMYARLELLRASPGGSRHRREVRLDFAWDGTDELIRFDQELAIEERA